MIEHLREQPLPRPSDGDCWSLVIQDMEERRRHGIEKYGAPVQPYNGRDALIDAYQEVLDLTVYLRQAIEERNKDAGQVFKSDVREGTGQGSPPRSVPEVLP